MAYEKQNWKNLPDKTTPITAERLGYMEEGIYQNSVDIEKLYKDDDDLKQIFDLIPYMEDEGEIISLDKTAQARLRSIELKGDTYQDSTSISGGDQYDSPSPDYPQDVHVVSGNNTINVCGKNLLPNEITTQTTSGITITKNEDGSLTINGSTTSGFRLKFASSLTLQAGTYMVSTKETSSSQGYFSFYEGSTEIFEMSFKSQANKRFTLNEETTIRPTIYISNNGTFNNYTIYPMLEKGNTATTYEPYQSASYPISLGVENLFDKDTASIISAYINTGNNQIASSIVGKSTYIKCKPNTTYTISKQSGKTFRWGTTATIPAVGTSVIDTVANNTASSITLTTGATANYLVVYFYNSDNDTATLQAMIDSIQITKGSTPQYISSTPIELCKIGDYQDSIKRSTGKNLFDINNPMYINQPLQGDGVVSGSSSVSNVSQYIQVQENTNYTLSLTNDSNSRRISFYSDILTSEVATSDVLSTISYNGNIKTFETPANCKYIRFSYYNSATNVQLEKGNQATIPEPYGINKWYVEKQIGKVVLDGSENWAYGSSSSTPTPRTTVSINNPIHYYNQRYYSNIFIYNNTETSNRLVMETTRWYMSLENTLTGVVSDDTNAQKLTKIKSYLSENNAIVYYVLSTPTSIEITDTNLIEQLETLIRAKSYYEQTNISQENNDMPFELSASAYYDLQALLKSE